MQLVVKSFNPGEKRFSFPPHLLVVPGENCDTITWEDMGGCRWVSACFLHGKGILEIESFLWVPCIVLQNLKSLKMKEGQMCGLYSISHFGIV